MVKFSWLTLILSFGLVPLASAQLYYPTLAELSGNGPTQSGNGYSYKFRGNHKINGLYDVNGTGPWDFTNVDHYAAGIDTINGYMLMHMDGQQADDAVMAQRFLFDNGGWGYGVDLTNADHRRIKLRLRSSVAVEEFGILIASDYQYTSYLIGDGSYETFPLEANQWQEIETTISLSTWDDFILDPTLVSGFGLFARNSSAPHPAGTIEIDWIHFGDAVTLSENPDGVNPDGDGYTFNFSGSSILSCNGIAALNSFADFSMNQDLLNGIAELDWSNLNSANDSIRFLFHDFTCGINDIDLSLIENRFAALTLEANTNVEIGLGLIGYDAQLAFNVSVPVSWQLITANTETSLQQALSLTGSNGQLLLSDSIIGVTLFARPSGNNRNQASVFAPAIKVKNLAVGKDATLVQTNAHAPGQSDSHHTYIWDDALHFSTPSKLIKIIGPNGQLLFQNTSNEPYSNARPLPDFIKGFCIAEIEAENGMIYRTTFIQN